VAKAERRFGRAALLGALLVAAVACLVGYLVLRAESLPAGPEPVAWDRVACARCQMLVSEPAFAAQLHTEAGEVLYFDDPGCLLLFVDERAPDVHAMYFHHLREDRWLSEEEVGFVPVETTPMGYGLGAVDRAAPDAIGIEDALRRAREREAARRRG
jgi:copper chaperone NosL